MGNSFVMNKLMKVRIVVESEEGEERNLFTLFWIQNGFQP